MDVRPLHDVVPFPAGRRRCVVLVLRGHESLARAHVAGVDVVENALLSATEDDPRARHVHGSGRSKIEIADVQLDLLTGRRAEASDLLKLTTRRIVTELHEAVFEVERARIDAIAGHHVDQTRFISGQTGSGLPQSGAVAVGAGVVGTLWLQIGCAKRKEPSVPGQTISVRSEPDVDGSVREQQTGAV